MHKELNFEEQEILENTQKKLFDNVRKDPEFAHYTDNMLNAFLQNNFDTLWPLTKHAKKKNQ